MTSNDDTTNGDQPKPAATSPALRRRSVTLGGSRELWIILLCLIAGPVLPRNFRGLFLLIAGVFAVWGIIHLSFKHGRRTGRMAQFILLGASIVYGIGSVAAYRSHVDLLSRLEPLGEIRLFYSSNLPTAIVRRIHLEDEITDDDLAKILNEPELSSIEFVYIDGSEITDEGFRLLGRLSRLQYIYLDGTDISADAVEAFKRRYDDCCVVVPQR